VRVGDGLLDRFFAHLVPAVHPDEHEGFLVGEVPVERGLGDPERAMISSMPTSRMPRGPKSP
jgi:hypothetical protein